MARPSRQLHSTAPPPTPSWLIVWPSALMAASARSPSAPNGTIPPPATPRGKRGVSEQDLARKIMRLAASSKTHGAGCIYSRGSDGRTTVNYVFGAAKHNRLRRALRAGYVPLRLRRQIELSPGASPANTDEADLLAVPDTLPDFAPWVRLLSAQGDRREEV
jgi:hypothetical protein